MNKDIYEQIGEKLKEETGSEFGQMFGKPCLKTASKKAFCAFFQDEMVFKIGKEEVPVLIEQYPGSRNWDPSGKNRAMKDWLQVPAEYQHSWRQLAQMALDYVNAKP